MYQARMRTLECLVHSNGMGGGHAQSVQMGEDNKPGSLQLKRGLTTVEPIPNK